MTDFIICVSQPISLLFTRWNDLFCVIRYLFYSDYGPSIHHSIVISYEPRLLGVYNKHTTLSLGKL